ncbi:MAG: hypothetical protein WC028_14660 [Candidatus Obscuribacterales bacterium]
MVALNVLKDWPVYLYWSLPTIYLYLAVSKVNFGWDGNELLWRLGVALSIFFASLLGKRILDSTPQGAKKKYWKALAALIGLPLMIHLLGITIINSAPGIGASF